MTTRLRPSTRLIATATTGAAAVAAVDVLDRLGPSTWAAAVALALAVGGALVARLHAVALEVDDDVVTVHNIVTTRRVPRDEVVAVVPGTWRSSLLLADGSEVPTLLREADLDDDLVLPTTVIDLTAIEATA